MSLISPANQSTYSGRRNSLDLLAMLKAATLVVVLVVPFLPTWTTLLEQWLIMDHALAHGGLIAVATLYFLFSLAQQSNVERASSAKAWFGFTLTLLFTLVATLSQRVAMDAVTQLALLGLLFSLILVFFPGATWLKTIQVSGLLVFALQAWGSLNGLLLAAASSVVGTVVGWMSIPTLIDGNSITLPYGVILIADGCSGLRYFVIALALAWILSINNRYTFTQSLVALFAAASLALLANWIRIYILILIGYYSQMESSLVQDHELFGWLLFGAFMLPAIYFAPQNKARDV